MKICSSSMHASLCLSINTSAHASVSEPLSVWADPWEYEMMHLFLWPSYTTLHTSVCCSADSMWHPWKILHIWMERNHPCVFVSSNFFFLSQVPEEDIVSVTEMLQAHRKDKSSWGCVWMHCQLGKGRKSP